MRIAANEEKRAAPIAEREVNQLSAVSGNRAHGDVQELADRLVEIVEAQDRSDFCGAEVEPERVGTRVDVAQRRAVRTKPELGRGDNDQVNVELGAAEWKCRPAQDFVRPVAHGDRAGRGVDRGTHRIGAFVFTDGDRFPDWSLCRCHRHRTRCSRDLCRPSLFGGSPTLGSGLAGRQRCHEDKGEHHHEGVWDDPPLRCNPHGLPLHIGRVTRRLCGRTRSDLVHRDRKNQPPVAMLGVLPLLACGERSDCEAIRVRGPIRAF